jgi:hypothetical protein
MTARREGYSQGIYMDGIFASIDFLRNAWKSPTTVDTPFWTHIVDVTDGKWITTDRYKRFISTIDSRRIYEFYGDKYIALTAKPYATIDELADDLASQIIELVNELKHIS